VVGSGMYYYPTVRDRCIYTTLSILTSLIEYLILFQSAIKVQLGHNISRSTCYNHVMLIFLQ